MTHYLVHQYDEDTGDLLYRVLARNSATYDTILFCPRQNNLAPCGEWCPFFEIKNKQWDVEHNQDTAIKVILGCMHSIQTILIAETIDEYDEDPNGS